tara:strand:- start:1918 stop:4827 length:2910 start_codon:yes stop_codon:yes gene_type:complete
MPLTRSGTDVREFLLPSIFEASTISQVREIPRPVDKAHSIVGSTGVGLVYKFDSSSSAADDGYEILRPDDTTWSGRWLLIPLGAASGGDGIYNVKSFGATGDGVTDDQASIQSAIDEATTKEGGIVFFPSGDYLIKATLVLTPGVRLMGVSGQDNTTASGIGSTISSQTVATPSVSFTGDGTTNNSSSVEVASLRIIDTGGTPTTAITFTSARNCYVNGCYFQGFSEAAVSLVSGEGNIVDRVMVGSSDAIGIKFSGLSKQSQLSNSKIEGCASASGAVEIIGTADGIRVLGNQITNNFGKGIYVSTPLSTTEHIAIENNLFDGNDATDTGDQDVYFIAATSHTNASIVGNQFTSVGTSTALKLESVSDSAIDNNSFAVANASITLDASSDNNLLLGNKISGTTSDLGSGNWWDLGYDRDEVNDRQLSKAPSNGLYFSGNQADKVATPSTTLGSAGDGTQDLPLSGAAVMRANDYTSAFVMGRQGSSSLECWWLEFDASDKLFLTLFDESAAASITLTQDVASVVDGEAVHVAFTYDGTGGASAANGATLYINGVAVAATAGATGTYLFSEALSQATTLGLSPKSGRTLDGDITSAALFNRELTAAEILRLSINGNVPEIADQWGNDTELVLNGSALDNASWTKSNVTIVADTAETTDPDGTNLSDKILASAGTSAHLVSSSSFTIVANRNYAFEVDLKQGVTNGATHAVIGESYGTGHTWAVFKFSTNTVSDSGGEVVSTNVSSLGDGWYRVTLILNSSTSTSMALRINPFDSDTTNTAGPSWTAAGTENIYSYRASFKAAGAVLSLNPDNIESDGDWIDASSNELNGTATGATPLMVQPQASGTFTPTIDFSVATGSIAYTSQVGVWRKISEKVIKFTVALEINTISGHSGNLDVLGLPQTSEATAHQPVSANLFGEVTPTSGVEAQVISNSTKMQFYDPSTDATRIAAGDIQAGTILRISGVYEIA